MAGGTALYDCEGCIELLCILVNIIYITRKKLPKYGVLEGCFRMCCVAVINMELLSLALVK